MARKTDRQSNQHCEGVEPATTGDFKGTRSIYRKIDEMTTNFTPNETETLSCLGAQTVDRSSHAALCTRIAKGLSSVPPIAANFPGSVRLVGFDPWPTQDTLFSTTLESTFKLFTATSRS
jgi:hypothetical protein